MAKGQTIDITARVRADISEAESKLSKLGSTIGNSLNAKGKNSGFYNEVLKIQDEYSKLQKMIDKPMKTSKDAQDIARATEALQKRVDSLSGVKIGTNWFDSSVSKQFTKLNEESKKLIETTKKISNVKIQISGKNGKGGLEGELASLKSAQDFLKSGDFSNKIFNKIGKSFTDSENAKISSYLEALKANAPDTSIYKQAKTDLEGLLSIKTQDTKTSLDGLYSSLNSLNKGKLDTIKSEIENTFNSIKTVANNTGDLNLLKELENIDLSNLKLMKTEGVQKLSEDLLKLAQTTTDVDIQSRINNIREALRNFSSETGNTLPSVASEAKAAWSVLADNEAAQRSIKSLTNRIEYFFSLQNGFRMVTRVLRDAYKTVTDLDKAMTDTAVVTNNTVGDMWKKLDEYTARANKLGATTQGAYETATLYYQQGLNDQQAGELSVETMKMARIAGMDYAKATDSMTAALRGFNKELTAASAQNVNDVYSNLAAKTASNTQEISTAMEKVASLAHNAGMDLETTAVYLSQAIETTREAPENIGTAMKTILARFQSLTKDPDSLSPEVQEALGGETVDANVTEAALRKAGVALRDETGQFRAAKDVLLELNAVWNDLDKNTQRYIATQTAGARQQSRFIAMMQNNARTQELLGYAYNSEGASQEQFEKTLESMEAKVNKLKNAWNEFTMGIANNTAIKAAVDALTGFLTIINKLTNGIDGPLGSAFSMITKSLMAIGGFKLGGSVVNQFVKILSGNFDREAIDISKIGIKGALQLGGSVFSQFSVGFTKAGKGFNWLKSIFSNGKINGLKELGSQGKSGIKFLLDSVYQNAEFGKLRGTGLGDKAAGSLMQNAKAFKQYQDLLKSGKTAEEAYAAAVLMTNAGMGDKAAMFYASKVAVTEENAAIIGAMLGLEGDTLATFKATAAKKGYAAALKEVALAEGEAAAGEYAMLGPLLIIGAVLAAAGIAWKIYSKSIEDACNRAEESIKSFNETKDSVTENLDKINEVSGDFEKLSKGVLNGENIGLSTAEFEKYHEIVNELVKINPSIVEGYDAQGNAIINTTSALRTLREEEERRLEIAKADYTSNSNLKDIITNVNEKNKEAIKNRQVVIEDNINKGQGYTTTRYMTAEEVLEKDKTYAQDRIELLKQIRKAEENGSNTEGLERQLDNLDSMHSAANEVKQDYSEIADVLNTYAGSLGNAASLQANFGNILSAGIQDIAASGKSAEEMKNDVNQLINTLNNSPEVLKAYKKAIREVDDAKAAFDNSVKDTDAIETYNDTVNNAYESMIKQAEKFEGATRDAMISAAESMRSYASEATVSLVEALNPLRANVEAARGLGEVLDDIKDKDYYSTSDSVHEVTQEALSEKNLAGPNGSRSFQRAASAYINEDYLAKHDYSKKASESMLRQIDKMTQEGRAGAEAFQDFYQQQLKDTKWLNDEGGLSFKSEEIGEVAKAMGLNESLFAALVEKYSQYTGASWVDDPKQVIEGALQDGTAFKGSGKDAKTTIWQDDLAEAANEAGVAFSIAKKNFEEGGGQVLSAAQMSGKELGKAFSKIGDEFKSAGDSLNTKAIVASMVASGKTEEEINSVLTKMSKDGVDLDADKDDWSDIIDNAQIAEAIAADPTANVIQSDVVSRLDAMLTIMGGRDLSDADANKDKSDKTVEEINNATDKNEDASENADQRINELYTENQAIKAALEKGNLDKGTKKQYEERLDSNEKQIENIKKAKEKNTSGIDAYNNAIEAITNKNDSDFLKAFSQLTKAQQTSFIENNKKAINKHFEDKGYDNTKLDASQKSSVLNTESKKGANIAQQQVNVYASVNDGDLNSFYDTLESLPKDVKTTLYTENPGYAVLEDYKTEIDELEGDEKKVVLKTVTEGDFNTEEWMDFAKEHQELAVGIQVETESLNGVKDIEIPGTLDISKEQIESATKGAEAHIQAYYDLTGQEPPEDKEAKVTYTYKDQDPPKDKTAHVKYITSQSTIITVRAGAARGKNLASSAFGQNILGSAAKGAKRGRLGPRGKGGLTLTGEVGPELVWEPSKSISYITGANGPEMRNLSGDAVVWPADQTKKIMRTAANGQNLFGSAYTSPTLSTSSSTFKKAASSASSSKKATKKNKDPLYNSLTRVYNLEQKINDELRIREKLNERYEEIVKLWGATTQQVGDILKESSKASQQIIKANQQIINSASGLMSDALTKAAGENNVNASTIKSYFNSDGTLNYDKYRGLNGTTKEKNKNLMKAIEQYAGDLESIKKQIEEAEDAITDEIRKIYDRVKENRDDYASKLNDVKDALVSRAQQQIDSLNKTNDTINNSNQRLIDSINKSLERERQARENEKTERDIADKRAQLALLKRDTSGANNAKIKQLEKEIAESEEDYTDTLIDQKLNSLEDQNQIAQEQRERQIELLQNILDYQSEHTRVFFDQADQLMRDAVANGSLDSNDELYQLLDQYVLDGKSIYEKFDTLTELNSALIKFEKDKFGGFDVGDSMKGIMLALENINQDVTPNQDIELGENAKVTKASTYDSKTKTGNYGQISDNGKTYDYYYDQETGRYVVTGKSSKETAGYDTITYRSHVDENGQWVTDKPDVWHDSEREARDKAEKERIAKLMALGNKRLYNSSTASKWSKLSKSKRKTIQLGLQDLANAGIISKVSGFKANGTVGDPTKKMMKQLQGLLGVSKSGVYDSATRTALRGKQPYSAFKTGGLADYTGPAWLDGTPSKPELVLNAKDTANFIQLKNVLSDIMKEGTAGQRGGDNYYDINIQVDSLGSDYDVEQLTKKIKKEIVKDSNYRNVNTVRRMK